MAHSALTSLMEKLERIHHPNQQIISVMEKVGYLLDFLEDSQNVDLTILDVERQIRFAANVEDIMISHPFGRTLTKTSTSLWKMFFADIQNLVSACLQFEAMHPGLELHTTSLRRILQDFESILESLPLPKSEVGQDFEHREPARQSKSEVGKHFEHGEPSRQSRTDSNDYDFVMDRLTGSSSKLDIISVVGMGGIGKTTLARNLYDSFVDDKYFDIRGWVTVSQKYDSLQVLSDLQISIGNFNENSHHEVIIHKLVENLYKSLKNRRYLIVVDDIWDTTLWHMLKRVFPDDKYGSRIILTTRNSKVALDAAADSPVHRMSFLGPEDSWRLLRNKVFGQENCPLELEKIGMKIAQDCKGLPLVISMIGDILSEGSKTQEHWDHIGQDVMSAISRKDYDQIMKVLSLSYNHLPEHLKRCFLYMGVFPKDQEIFVSQLIMLWVAEGFVKPLGSKSYEEVAEEYLNELVDRNLIYVFQRNHCGNIKTCGIHVLLRDMCVQKADKEKFLRVIDLPVCALPGGSNNNHDRVSIHGAPLGHHYIQHLGSVRSLLYFVTNFSNDGELVPPVESLRHVEVLDVLSIAFHEVPAEIFKLGALKYLALVCTAGEQEGKPHAWLSNLQNLQSLIFYSTTTSIHLPPEIWNMSELKYLLINGGFLPYPTSTSQDDSGFITISLVHNFRCTAELAKILPNLKKLGVYYSADKTTDWSSYGFNHFVFLTNLETFKCIFLWNTFQRENQMNLSYEFPHRLRKLTLSGCRVSWYSMRIISSLHNLEVLKLKFNAFKGPIWEPEEGGFVRLKFLLLHRMDLIRWEANETHFPELEHLSISYCYQLQKLPTEIGFIPTLSMLEVYECSPRSIESAKQIQEEQHESGNDDLQVHFRCVGDDISRSFGKARMISHTRR